MSTMPLPQCGLVHAFEQPSSLFWFASSHSSLLLPRVSVLPSPQTLSLQAAVQSLLSALLPGPSSHSSPAVLLILPSPHDASVQSRLQPAVSSGVLFEPKSHCSTCVPAVCRTPSPQCAILQ